MSELVRIEGLIVAQLIFWLTSCDAAALTRDSVDGRDPNPVIIQRGLASTAYSVQPYAHDSSFHVVYFPGGGGATGINSKATHVHRERLGGCLHAASLAYRSPV